ncbi:hypothetical protein MBLNU457_1736t1 [Dothideomycetes sp. NU457]
MSTSLSIPKDKTLPGRKKGTACYKRTLLKTGTVYILDDDHETKGRRRIKTIHRQKCGLIREAFATHTPYQVSSVPSCKSEEDLLTYWRDTLRAKADHEITVIYFHGDAGRNGEDFTMSLKGQNFLLNGYKFLELLCKSEKHVFVLLDCYFPRRFKDRQGLQRRPTCEAAFEIVASGTPGQDTEGNREVTPFTDCIVEHIERLVEKANDDELTRTACFTLSELLGSKISINEALDDNPIRFTTSDLRPQFKMIAGKEVEVDKVVPRLYLDPEYIRENKMLAFQCDIVKDTKKAREEKEQARKTREQSAGILAKPISKPDSVIDEGFDEDGALD